MLGLIEDFCKDFDQQRTKDLFLINLDQSKFIIREVNAEQNSTDLLKVINRKMVVPLYSGTDYCLIEFRY